MPDSIARSVRTTLGIVATALLLASCKHGVAIKGEGDVTSLSGTRDCAGAEAPCRFDISGDYQETYTSVAAPGWLHDSWELCLAPSGNKCTFAIPAAIVADFEGQSIPSAVARFRKPINPLFPVEDGAAQLPDTPAARQFAWFMTQLAANSTSMAQITQHFHPDFLAATSAATIQQQFESYRAAFANAEAVDVISVTPNFLRIVIGNPGALAEGAFVTLSSEYAGTGLITEFSVNSPFPQNGSNTNVADADLTLEQLAQKFSGLAQNTAMLVARIDNDRCGPVLKRQINEPLPTASIFKLWVLGALAEAIKNGAISASDIVPLSADEMVPAGATINDEPLGTQFPLADMAALMLGRSDNTATDHIHELVGRDKLEAVLKQFNHKNRELMTPLLSVNEQFHILWSLTPQQADDYASGSEEYQRGVLEDVIEPLGPVSSFPYNNREALSRSSWQASPMDICAAYAGLRTYDNRSDAFNLLDQAIGAEAVLLGVRTRWDRVWQKGGSFDGPDGSWLFNLSWLFESDERGAFVLVLMANNEDGSAVDSTPMFSIASRVEEILISSY